MLWRIKSSSLFRITQTLIYLIQENTKHLSLHFIVRQKHREEILILWQSLNQGIIYLQYFGIYYTPNFAEIQRIYPSLLLNILRTSFFCGQCLPDQEWSKTKIPPVGGILCFCLVGVFSKPLWSKISSSETHLPALIFLPAVVPSVARFSYFRCQKGRTIFLVGQQLMIASMSSVRKRLSVRG